MTTINDIHDLVEVLRNHPDWLETLQDILLTDYGKDNKAELDEILRRLDRLDDRLENQEGAFYEARVARNIQSLAGQQLDLVRVRVLHGGNTPTDPALLGLLGDASERDDGLHDQANQLLAADVIIEGRRGGCDTEYAVIEASVTIRSHDITRAAQRAATLAQLTGQPALAVAVGTAIQTPQTAEAETLGVRALLYSHA